MKIPPVSVPLSGPLEGFEEFDKFAYRTSPVWNQVTQRCRASGIPEEDRLRLLCFAVFTAHEKLEQELLGMAARHPLPTPVLIPTT